MKRKRELPEGWRVGEPVGDDGQYRCIYRGTVVDGRPTLRGAFVRCCQIAENRQLAQRRLAEQLRRG